MADHDSDSDIDAETLQAQIDMSMAYAQDVVSGWMKASGTLASSSANGSSNGGQGKKRDVEKELEEMMKRPPRCVFVASFQLTQFLMQAFLTFS